MKTYKEQVTWVARNDNESDLDVRSVSRSLTVALVADIWGVTTLYVAAGVVNERKGAAKR